MSRSIDEIEEIIDKIREKVFLANRIGELDNLLLSLGLTDFVEPSPIDEHYKCGKIVVIGNSDIKESILLGICKECGIGKERLEFCLDYNLAQKFNYRKMQYNSAYSVVMFGPVPHSTIDKKKSESIIAELESQKGYPPVVRLNTGNELKITKTNFKKAICTLLNDGVISSDY